MADWEHILPSPHDLKQMLVLDENQCALNGSSIVLQAATARLLVFWLRRPKNWFNIIFGKIAAEVLDERQVRASYQTMESVVPKATRAVAPVDAKKPAS